MRDDGIIVGLIIGVVLTGIIVLASIDILDITPTDIAKRHQVQAVKRGFAEWKTTDEGETTFQWKEDKCQK